MTREEMIKQFLQLFVVEADHQGAEVALTLIVQTLEQRAELRGQLCGGLTPRGGMAPDGAVTPTNEVTDG